jgi:hypothetical protein
MGLFKNIMAMLVIIAIIGVIVYYFNLFGFKSIVVTSVTPPTLPTPKIINGSVGNNAYANYGSQYKVAVNITKKYNEPINHTILFTGNSSNATTETINQNDFSTDGTSDYVIDYQGLYVPIYENISDVYTNNSSYFYSLIGKVVHVEFSLSYNSSSPIIQVPYTVQSEKIIGNMVYWHLTQDTGISNNNAINLLKANDSVFNNTINYIIGIYYNGTEIIFPRG